MAQIGRLLLFTGLGLAALGVLLLIGGRLGLGRLPGDVVIERKNFTLHAPIVTSIILSLLLTLALNFFLRRR